MKPTILAIDCSSVAIGYVLYRDTVTLYGEWQLAGPIEARCRQAYSELWQLLEAIPQPDALAIESPVLRFAGTIPQIRVSGALLTLAGQRGIPVLEVSPTAAKNALCGTGRADKALMIANAAGYGVLGEHAADALGVALAASKRVEVVPA